MSGEDREFERTLELLREAHREPIDEAHYAAVRARVLAKLETQRRRWLGVWVYGLVAAALVLWAVSAEKVGRTPWSARVPLDPPLARPQQIHVASERPTGGSAADRGVRPTLRKRSMPAAYRVVGPPAVQPLVVKLVTNDPDVVIYWFSGE
jgi:hypothetical protein